MALIITENVILGRDNSIDLILKENGTAIGTSAVTRIDLLLGKTLITSTNNSTHAILWNQAGYLTGEIRIFIGQSSYEVKPGKYMAQLIVYDALSTRGIVWDDDVPIRVLPNPST